MAKYNRDFLVPYLRNVCALELAYDKLYRRGEWLQYAIDGIQNGVVVEEYPSEPRYDPPLQNGFLRVAGIGTLLFALLMFTLEPVFGWFCIIGGGMELLLSVVLGEQYKEEYGRERAKYNEAMDEYKRNREYNAQRRRELPGLKAELDSCLKERNRVDQVLDQVYAANVIPGNYRNLYASVYLYDWFSTGGGDDMDIALNTYVLEEIKARLDAIINQLSTVLLNQEIMKARQQDAMQQQQRHSAIMRQKMNQIIAGNEERNRYLGMIESNTATTAFFAAANYLRHL